MSRQGISQFKLVFFFMENKEKEKQLKIARKYLGSVSVNEPLINKGVKREGKEKKYCHNDAKISVCMCVCVCPC